MLHHYSSVKCLLPSKSSSYPVECLIVLDANRERLNKSLAHISYKRIEYQPKKEWNYLKIHKEITGTWDEFFSRLPEEKREWFTRPRDGTQGVIRL